MENLRKQIAYILKHWLKESSYTQAKLASELGTTQPVLSRQLNGVENISLERICAITEVLSPPKEDLENFKKLLNNEYGGYDLNQLTSDDHKRIITEYINSWVKKSESSVKDVALFLHIPTKKCENILNGKDELKQEYIKLFKEKFNPPENEYITFLRHYFWKDSTPEKKTNLAQKVQKVIDKIDSAAFDKKMLNDIMSRHEEEVCMLMDNKKDRLLVELMNSWFKLDKTEKLKILTFVTELEKQKDN